MNEAKADWSYERQGWSRSLRLAGVGHFRHGPDCQELADPQAANFSFQHDIIQGLRVDFCHYKFVPMRALNIFELAAHPLPFSSHRNHGVTRGHVRKGTR